MLRTLAKLILILAMLSAVASAQDPAKWKLSVEPSKNGEFNTLLEATIENGWHLYALDQPVGGPIAATIEPSDPSSFEIVGKIVSSPAKTSEDKNFEVDGKPLETKYFENTATFRLVLRSLVKANSDVESIGLSVRYQVCNDTFCLPARTKNVTVSGEEIVKKPAVAPVQTTPQVGNADPVAKTPDPSANGLWNFILLAATLGALSLLTPCVFPMIPITVSYFTNHSSGSRSRSIRLAAIYSIGIVATFTIIGMVLAVFVGAAGINLFAANPWVNLLIAGIFLFFAFNLFGAYEIAIPPSILTKLDSVTRSREGEGSGVIGALLMGLTFSLTSFTCTSPFVGTILVSAAQGSWQTPLIGMLAFSTVFAIPFFILALVPQWMAQLPRAGGWMNSVKVAMGFLEAAAAMKFISNVDLVWHWGIFSRNVVLSIWIAIGIILSLYLLGKFQLAHDSKPERIGAFRLASAVLSLAVSLYLITGLFGSRLGELEAFLPPLPEVSSLGDASGGNTSDWITNDHAAALETAKKENKRVLIDFTGYTCTNCRWMESNIFTQPDVAAEMNKFVRSRLYTDGSGEIYERQQQFEESAFGTVALPFYAIVDGSGKTIATFPGLTRSKDDFIDFLKKGQEY